MAESLGITNREKRPEYQFYYLWPNMYVDGGISQRGYGGSFGRLWPDGVHAWKGENVRYQTPDTEILNEEVAKQIAEWWQMTIDEDRDAAGRVQAGLRSGMYTWGYTLPESERNMRHFYALVWRALAPAFRA